MMEIKTSGRIVVDNEPLMKKWVAVDDITRAIIKVENKRTTDNVDYISIPMIHWLDFKEWLNTRKDNKMS